MTVKFNFAGKVILVTGGSQGIGLATAHAFRDAGAIVHITGTREDSQFYDADFSGLVYHRASVENVQHRAALSAALTSIDVLINNAGIANTDEYQIEGFRETLAVNLEAVAAMCYLFKERLAMARGVIVNTASVASFIALSDRPAYTASKHALLGLTKALGDRWAKRGIRVNCVAPGFVNTRIIDHVTQDEDTYRSMLSRVPLARFAEPSEIASAILFLSSGAAGYIVGQALVVDGGFTLR